MITLLRETLEHLDTHVKRILSHDKMTVTTVHCEEIRHARKLYKKSTDLYNGMHVLESTYVRRSCSSDERLDHSSAAVIVPETT